MDTHFTVIKKCTCHSLKSIHTPHTSLALLSSQTQNVVSHFLGTTNHSHLMALATQKMLKLAVKKKVLLHLGKRASTPKPP